MGADKFAISSIVNVVDLVEVVVIEENADIFLAVLAEAFCMPGPEVQFHFLLALVSEK